MSDAVNFAIELLEYRRLLSATAIDPNDAVPFQHIVIDPNPPESPIMKILGDLTNSGDEDAIVGHETNFGPGGLDWYQFPASGNPSDPWTEHVIDPTADVYESAAVANIDGKGYNDIVVAERGTIYLYQNPLEIGGNVDGTWPKIVVGSDSVSNGGSAHEMYLADIDGDGKTDIVTSDAIYFQNSPTSWTTVDSPTTYNRTEKGTALFDSGSGNGAVDIAGTGDAADNFAVGWYENPRDAGGNARTNPWVFHAIGPAYSGYTSGDEISYATLDVNGDGRQDIVTDFGEGSSLLPGGLIWWEAPANRATGTWIQNLIDPTSQYVHNLRIGDFNGDGTPEIFAFEQDQSAQERLNVYYNEGGTGQNWLVQTLATTGGQNEWLGDITGDGDLDILNSRHGVNDGPAPIEVFMNQLVPDGIVRPAITTAPASQTAAPGSNVTFNVAVTGTGPLTYQWQLNDLDISGANSGSFIVSNIQSTQSGSIYRCIVGNPAGLIPSAGAMLTVKASNGPVVNAGPNETITLPANSVQLRGSVVEGGANLTSTWTQQSGAASVNFTNPASPTTTATFPGSGSYVLQLAGSDGTYTNTSTVTITVNPDPGPTVSAGPNQSITLPNNMVSLAGSATESLPQGYSLTDTWSLINGPAAVVFANGSAAATTATFSVSGTYTLQLQATDGTASNSSQVTITVNPAGTYTGTPFPGPSAAAIPGTLQAENFDNGGQGVAYNWQTATNPGNANYRPGTGVGIETTSDTGGGDDVGYAVAGDWVNYSVNAATTGTYSLNLRVAQKAAGGQMHVDIDGENVTGTISVPNTGGWQNWQTLTVTGISLTAGPHLVTVYFDTNATDQWVGNLNWLSFD